MFLLLDKYLITYEYVLKFLCGTHTPFRIVFQNIKFPAFIIQ